MRPLALACAAAAALLSAAPASAHDLTLDGPGATTYGHQVTFTGRLSPPEHRVRVGIYLGSSVVAWTLTNERGFFVARPDLHTEGAYRARAPGAVSPPHTVEIVGGRPAAAAPPVGVALDDPSSVSRRLAELGYAVADLPARQWDGWLRQSVYAFQKAQGITVDGIVGPETRAALRDPDPVRPRHRSPGDHLEVDKDRQLLLVVRDGDVVRVSNASTAGIPGYRTPEGRFRIFRRVAGIDKSRFGKLWNPLYFYRGWAIHGSTTVPPEPASHGCVRVPLWEAKRLFENVPHNQVVYVY